MDGLGLNSIILTIYHTIAVLSFTFLSIFYWNVRSEYNLNYFFRKDKKYIHRFVLSWHLKIYNQMLFFSGCGHVIF